jgi:hypothetical protein
MYTLYGYRYTIVIIIIIIIHNTTSKVNFSLEKDMKAQRGSRGKLYSFFNPGTWWGWVVNSMPGRFTPGKETRYPLFRRPGGPQGRSGQVRKISPPPGFDPRTVLPAASRYTDYAIPAHTTINITTTTITEDT